MYANIITDFFGGLFILGVVLAACSVRLWGVGWTRNVGNAIKDEAAKGWKAKGKGWLARRLFK